MWRGSGGRWRKRDDSGIISIDIQGLLVVQSDFFLSVVSLAQKDLIKCSPRGRKVGEESCWCFEEI